MPKTPCFAVVRIIWKKTLFLMLLLGILPAGRGAAEEPTALPLTQVNMSEQAYMEVVLAENDGIRRQKIERLIIEQGISNSESIFDPDLVLSYEKGYGFEENDTEDNIRRGGYAAEYEFKNKDYSASVQGLLPTGTDYRVYYELEDPANSLQQDYNYGSENTARFGIEIKQPLLKNFGFFPNQAAVRLAEGDHVISGDRLRKMQMTTAYQAAVNYASLQLAQSRVALENEMLGLEKERIELMEKLVREGRGSSSDLHLARSQMLRRESRLSASFRLLRRASSEVRRMLVGAGNVELVNVTAEAAPTDISAPTLPDSARLSDAVAKRPEYQEALRTLEQDKIRLRYAENQALPEFDLHLKGGKTGFGQDLSEANSKLDEEHKFWSIGATLTIPLFGKEGDSTIVAAKLRRQKAEDSLLSLESLIKDEIIAAHDSARQSHQEAEHYREAVSAMEQALVQNRTLFKEGKLNRIDLLNSQLELNEAKTLLVERLYENRRAMLEFALAEGRILEPYNL